ncbi:archease, partial [Candidatus Pacearchaeota archaeon]|nr:archease [Candidatus Pacearchaeota archaeon]
TAELYGDKASNYDISLQVKAITYHDMLIESKDKKWIAQVVVDV